MRQYKVTLKKTILVQAESFDDAREKAIQMLKDGKLDLEKLGSEITLHDGEV